MLRDFLLNGLASARTTHHFLRKIPSTGAVTTGNTQEVLRMLGGRAGGVHGRASERILHSKASWIAGSLFVAGLAVTGVWLGVRYHFFNGKFVSFKTDIARFYNGEISAETMIERDSDDREFSLAGTTSAISAFVLFVAGSIVAFSKLPTVAHGPQVNPSTADSAAVASD